MSGLLVASGLGLTNHLGKYKHSLKETEENKEGNKGKQRRVVVDKSSTLVT